MRFLLLLAILLVGCEPKVHKPTDHKDAVLKGIVYIKDKRTGLCFAYSDWKTYESGITHVPCKAVEKYLE
jgi:hypothetical protein